MMPVKSHEMPRGGNREAAGIVHASGECGCIEHLTDALRALRLVVQPQTKKSYGT
jgi:hypothetical protein